MNRFAIAVGIDTYPHFAEAALRCAVNDATAFAAWAAAQGAVDEGRLHLSPPVPEAASPDRTSLLQALLAVLGKAREAVEAAGPLPSQRDAAFDQTTLFVYFAGHGLGLMQGADVAMLTLEAQEELLGMHLSARELEETFIASRRFRNVFVIADCCRTERSGVSPTSTGLTPAPGEVGHHTRVGLLFSTQDGSEAREGAHHGFFSRALLEGLYGAAAGPFTGEVAYDTLLRWINLRLPTLMKKPQEIEPRGGALGEEVLGRVDSVLAQVPDEEEARRTADREHRDAFLRAMLAELQLLADGPGLGEQVPAARQVVLDRFAAQGAWAAAEDGEHPTTLAFADDFDADVVLLRLGEGGRVIATEHRGAGPWQLALAAGAYLLTSTQLGAQPTAFTVPAGGPVAVL